jgi:hypothetical protein
MNMNFRRPQVGHTMLETLSYCPAYMMITDYFPKHVVQLVEQWECKLKGL